MLDTRTGVRYLPLVMTHNQDFTSTQGSIRRRRSPGPRLERPLEWRRTGLKICLACRQAKPATEEHYGFSKGSPWPRCRPCIAKAESAKASYLRRLYGLTKSDYDVMLMRQDGRCAICRRPPSVQIRRLGVDHDHRTGRIRGLLCSGCNVGIAGLREDPEVFAAALRYLELHRSAGPSPA